jgi:hypothetical protein
VGGLHDVEPFLGVQLVVAQRIADFVVEDFRRRAGQGAKAGFLQPRQIFGDRQAQRRRALLNFQRREGVDMHARHGLFHRAAQFQIGLAGIVGMDAALHADFGRAAIPGLDGAPRTSDRSRS